MKFAVVFPWPGSNNAETEVIRRIQFVASKYGHQCDVLNNHGTLLHQMQDVGNKTTQPGDYEFIISAHFLTPKVVDSYYYHVLWNPIHYIFEDPANPVSINNILSCDDFLQSNAEKCIQYLESFAHAKGRFDNGVQRFFASAPDIGLRPKLNEKFKIFYCGINWELYFSSKGRFYDYFQELDGRDCARFFGPREINGAKPWGDFVSYAGEVPFDGVSILKRIHECGVSLVLQSDAHERSGGMQTNRLFESLAAGALVIANPCDFLEKEFGDSILYINHFRHGSSQMAQETLDHVEWIRNNLAEAQQKAVRSQEIFREKFSMDVQLGELIKNHPIRKKLHKEKFFAKAQDDIIDVVVTLDDPRIEGVERSLDNLARQNYKSINALICVADTMAKRVRSEISRRPLDKIKVTLIEYAEQKLPPNSKWPPLSRGAMINMARKFMVGTHVALMDGGCEWFSDHLTTLKRPLDDDRKAKVAYSGVLNIPSNTIRHPMFSNEAEMGPFGEYSYRGNFLMTKDHFESISQTALDMFHVMEGLIFLFKSVEEKTARYSRRVTSGLHDTIVQNINYDYWRSQELFGIGILGFDWRPKVVTPASTEVPLPPVISDEHIRTVVWMHMINTLKRNRLVYFLMRTVFRRFLK
jgi:hypothetical protein